MKLKIALSIILAASTLVSFGQNMRANSDGTVAYPTNFWSANALKYLAEIMTRGVKTNSASATTDGWLSSNSWSAFNAKQAALGYTPATNSNSGITTALGYTPATNSNSGITTALGYTPATNSNSGIASALGYTPATNSPAGITSALTYAPATNSNSGITSALGYTPATNSNAGITSALGFAPAPLSITVTNPIAEGSGIDLTTNGSGVITIAASAGSGGAADSINPNAMLNGTWTPSSTMEYFLGANTNVNGATKLLDRMWYQVTGGQPGLHVKQGYYGSSLTLTNQATIGGWLIAAGGFVGPNLGITGINEASFSFSDTTSTDSSTVKHGLMPKLSGNTNEFINGQGQWEELLAPSEVLGPPGSTNTSRDGSALIGLTATNLDQMAVLFSPAPSVWREPPIVVGEYLWNETETVTNTTAYCLTNLFPGLRAAGWKQVWDEYQPEGTPIFFDYNWGATNRVNDQIGWNTYYFPSGSNVVNMCYSNNYLPILWFQDTPAVYGTIAQTNIARLRQDFAYAVTNWLTRGGGIWWDANSFAPNAAYSTFAASELLGRYGTPISLDVGVGVTEAQNLLLFDRVSSVRDNYFGDPTTFASDLLHWDYIQTNGIWRFVKPYHHLHLQQVGYWARTADEYESHFVMIAMMSSSLYVGLVPAATSMPTNRVYLDVLKDPWVKGARRVSVSNNIHVYVKPLGRYGRPAYAVSALNTSNATAAATINWKDIGLGITNWFVFDILNQSRDNRADPGLCSETTVSLATHKSAMWLLTQPLPVNTQPVPVLSAQAGTAWTSTSHDNWSGPFGPGGAFARQGYRTVLDGVKHGIWPIPEGAKWVMVNQQVAGNAVAWFTNQAAASRMTTAGTVGGSTTTAFAVPVTNGVVNVGYTVGFPANTLGETKWITETWNASSNTTATVKLMEAQISHF